MHKVEFIVGDNLYEAALAGATTTILPGSTDSIKTTLLKMQADVPGYDENTASTFSVHVVNETSGGAFEFGNNIYYCAHKKFKMSKGIVAIFPTREYNARAPPASFLYQRFNVYRDDNRVINIDIDIVEVRTQVVARPVEVERGAAENVTVAEILERLCSNSSNFEGTLNDFNTRIKVVYPCEYSILYNKKVANNATRPDILIHGGQLDALCARGKLVHISTNPNTWRVL